MSLEHIYSGEVRERATSTASLDTRLDLNRRYQSVDFAAWHMKRLAVRPGEKILDVGCGTGSQSLRFLADIGPKGNVSALDISEASVAALIQASGDDPRLEAVASDMADLPTVIRDQFTQKQYTLAQSAYALYYSPERESVLRTMAESIYDFGRVAVFTPAGPHGMVELASKFGAVPEAVYDSLNFAEDRLLPMFRQLFWDVRVDYFQSEMRVTSLTDFMDFYRATTYFDEAAAGELEDYARREIEATGAVTYAKNGFLIQGSSTR
jgi:ubiquinone/menaquinone biosynthesis C-methylase UbiE